jgi:hypothetical protein
MKPTEIPRAILKLYRSLHVLSLKSIVFRAYITSLSKDSCGSNVATLTKFQYFNYGGHDSFNIIMHRINNTPL